MQKPARTPETWTYLGTIDDTHYYHVPDSDGGPGAVWKLPPDRHWKGVCVWQDWPKTPEARQIEQQATN